MLLLPSIHPVIVSLLLPLLAVLVCIIIGSKAKNLRDVLIFTCAVLLAMHCFGMVSQLLDNQVDYSLSLITIFPNVDIAFHLEPLGAIFISIVSILWAVATVYCVGYMRENNEASHSRFFAYYCLSIFAAMGIAFSANLFSLFVFYEVLTFCTYPLVTHKQNDDAKKGGRIYLSILVATSLCFLLPAIFITYVTSGTLDFTNDGVLQGTVAPWVVGLLLFGFAFGIGKAALMPFQAWLPSAMVAPTPVSALLHAVAVVKAGVFSIVKIIVYIFGVDFLSDLIDDNWWYGGWLIWVAAITILIASLLALKHDNIKKRLAYSTVSQLSYVVMATMILAPKSITAAAFHIAAHAFSKITLFFAAGSIYTAAHKTKISQLDGIGKAMPWTMGAFAIGALSMIGIPPAVGFLTKWYMVVGALDSKLYWVLLVLLASTLLNAAYFLPIIYRAFFVKKSRTTGITIDIKHGEASPFIVVPLCFTALISLVLFFYPGMFLTLATMVVQ